MCDASMLWPLATVTSILLESLHGCTFDKHLLSRTAMYTPDDPESAFAVWEVGCSLAEAATDKTGFGSFLSIEKF